MLFVSLIIAIQVLMRSTNYQVDNQVIYALNEISNTNLVRENQEILWHPFKRVQSSYVVIRQKPDKTFYIQIIIRGQFGYGGYFKYIGKDGAEYKYHRIDGISEDYLYVNNQLSVISNTQKYDESITMRMLNYQTSYGLFMKF